MDIRYATLDDMDLLLSHDKHISREILERRILDKRVYIMTKSGTFMGWLRYNMFWDNTPFLNMLYILEEYRENGFGKMALDTWATHMKNLGHDTIMASTLSNERAVPFYLKNGYKIVGGFNTRDGYELILIKKI